MRIVGLPRSFRQLARHRPLALSERAAIRLRLVSAWMALRARGAGSQEAAEVVGVSRASLYRWWRDLELRGPGGLEDQSRAPQRRRLPTWSAALLTGSPGATGAVPRLGQRPTGGALAPERLEGRCLHGGTHPALLASTGAPARTIGPAHRCPETAAASALCPAQAQGLRGAAPRRPGPTRHPECAPVAWSDPQALRRSRPCL